MPKRKNESETEEDFINKIQIIDNQDELNQTNLPTEVIMHIFGYLDKIEDIRNCMLVCKEIRHSIFRSPKMMRKMVIKTDEYNWKDFQQFINDKQKFIRNIKFEFRVVNEKYVKFVLNQVPNIEKLIHCNYNGKWYHDLDDLSINDGLEPADMSKLKSLLVESKESVKIIGTMKNTKKLENLEFRLTAEDSFENFTNFVAQQNNLKELGMKYWNYHDNRKFPTRDISKEVKFQLKVLKLQSSYNDNPHFLTFFQTQAEKLEELSLVLITDVAIFRIIFTMCRNLKKLSLRCSNSIIYSELYPDYKLESLKFLTDSKFSTSELTAACARFPNLESLKCRMFYNISGTFENIRYLELESLKVDKFLNVKFPNLRKLYVSIFENSLNEKNLLKFIENNPKIEIFKLSNIEINSRNLGIFKYLKLFKNIRNFDAKFYEEQEPTYEQDGSGYNEVYKDPIEYKISIDFEKKTVKSGKYLQRKKSLKSNFSDFEFIEEENNNNIWSGFDCKIPNRFLFY